MKLRNELTTLSRSLGLSNQQVADILKLSLSTLVGRLYRKPESKLVSRSVESLKTKLELSYNEVARKRGIAIIPVGGIPSANGLFSMALAVKYVDGLSKETTRIMRIIND